MPKFCFVLDSFEKTICWTSHTDYIEKEPEGVTVTVHTPVCPVAAIFGLQGDYDLNFIHVNAQERFCARLKKGGVEEPEAKRKIIEEEFIRVFEEEAKKTDAVDFLV